MSESADASSGAARGAGTPAAEPDELERLRELIVPGERDRLASLERRLGDPDVRAEELSQVLPESLLRATRRDSRVGAALSPVLEEALAASIRRNRRQLAEVLAPAMGPAIRRAIAEALRSTVDSFNEVLQHSFSPRALGWRLEAWRSGRPFAEVVLSHSLVYRVEQVFLVHRETGLLLRHVAADPAAARDGDLVSGMLTAIQDFVRDSFSVEPDQGVDTLRVGDLAVWIEQGDQAYVAAAIRGMPPVGLRSVLRDALETIRIECSDAFDAFSGRTEPFEGARRHLEGCLQMRVEARRGPRYWLVPAILGSLAVLLLGVWLTFDILAARRWETYLARLRAEPGIVVVGEQRGLRHSSVTGLTDPYAASPDRLLGECGLDPARVTGHWKPYVSLDPPIVLARAEAALRPPGSVTLALDKGTLSASGSAPHGWIRAASARAVGIPGVLGFDGERLVDEALAELEPVRRRLESVILRFDVGSAELPPRERAAFDRAAAATLELAAIARRNSVALGIDILGHTDGTGSERSNVRLSRARAEWALSALEASGARDVAFGVVGLGASRPLRAEQSANDRALNRSVTFQVFERPAHD